MQDILFYTGIGINIVGAILLAYYGVRYYLIFKEADRMPMRMAEFKARWQNKRRLAFGLIFAGLIIAIFGLTL